MPKLSAPPLFSVLCTNYNNATHIPDMVKSLMEQTYTNWECVFLDDGSSDHSLEVVQSFSFESRIRIFSTPINIGAGAAAKFVARKAKGCIMGRLDSDDALTPNAIQTMVQAHYKHPKASLITSQIIACDKNLVPEKPPWIIYQPIPKGMSILEHPTVGAFASFKTESYHATSGFHPRLRRAVDLDIYIKLEEVGEVEILHDKLYKYRRNINGISQGNNGITAKTQAYQVMIDAYFRRKSTKLKPNLTRTAARAMRLRQHQIETHKVSTVLAPMSSLIAASKLFPELLINPTIWRNSLSATVRSLTNHKR